MPQRVELHQVDVGSLCRLACGCQLRMLGLKPESGFARIQRTARCGRDQYHCFFGDIRATDFVAPSTVVVEWDPFNALVEASFKEAA
jgi:hypothetical protein